MANVVYENESAVLSFVYEDVAVDLSRRIKEYRVEEDSTLLAWLREASADGTQDIRISAEKEYAEMPDVARVAYVIKDLLSQGIGKVYCKACDRDMASSAVQNAQISVADPHAGIDSKNLKALKKSLGLKGPVRLPGRGTTSFCCSNGHELFATTNWIT